MRTILDIRCLENNKSLSRQGSALSLGLYSPLTLSHLESGHAVPFSPQDFCSPCEFVHCSHNTRILRAAVHIKLVIMVSWDLRSASDSTIVCGTIQGISTCWFLGVHVWSQANEGLYSILRMRPRLLWLSGLSASLQTKALPV